MLIRMVLLGSASILASCLFSGSEDKKVKPGFYNVDEYTQMQLKSTGEFESRIYTNHFYGSSKPSESEPSSHFKGKWRINGGKYQTKLDSQRIYNEPITIDNPNPRLGWSDWKKSEGDYDSGYNVVESTDQYFSTQNCIYGINFKDTTECFITTWNKNVRNEFDIPKNCTSDCDFKD